ncbi:diaminopimelate decarboxylase [Candidatus Woesearchaeota archaeon]|jgi:diaminopimelate decarboxylase|nr:diaminopimelate decarboxylase [Candidatus Woesearchaeota archaeon]MBT4368329.1 diaminopimelate decarboxylase [Candidatus Woesearchaeota archaeon]MBT4712818.1 diaminopimelate decarboxylase [Candidatus Woesearchaeota archaeon]MBT6639730.1 diaminopimelate decarboxylase [Candidatus Woesearchaeota archaeon]MBT7133902.1 diaminopimelate decarboxylase [Candidatus Woesearchaeota archaeon]
MITGYDHTCMSGFGQLTGKKLVELTEMFEPPFYVYDMQVVNTKHVAVKNMPNAFGLRPRYAMKANSNRSVLQFLAQRGWYFDCSTLNEVRRLRMAGIPVNRAMLTSQEVPSSKRNFTDLKGFMQDGMIYNICSRTQLELVHDFAATNNLPVAMGVHPGEGGSGESGTRNTADHYSCFRIHISEFRDALKDACDLRIVTVHDHIGSGGSPAKWQANVDRLPEIIEANLDLLPHLQNINFGGGVKEGRMPGEERADLNQLGRYAKQCLISFAQKTGRRLTMEIEPGTYMVANAGYVVTKVVDKKSTGADGFDFIVLEGGCMTLNARPAMYCSEHPFYVVGTDGKILSTERELSQINASLVIPVGTKCESGDSWALIRNVNEAGEIEEHVMPRFMADPGMGDYFVVGGCGAYCSTMTPANYNSDVQPPEVLLMPDGEVVVGRVRQTLEQVVQNERGLPDFNPSELR